MFPIRWNFPFRKKDGSISTIGDEISAGGGGGGGYELPTASAETKGGVKIGSGLAMDGEVLKNSNPTPYSLPTASDEILGGVKVGSGLSISDGVLSTNGGSGGNIYNHIIAMSPDSNNTIYIYIVSNSSTPFTFASLCEFLFTNNINNLFPATGFCVNNNDYTPVIGIKNAGVATKLYYTELTVNGTSNHLVSSSNIFSDKVL